MALKTPEEYVESLRALKIRAYVGGERVDSIVDSPRSRRTSTRPPRPTSWRTARSTAT